MKLISLCNKIIAYGFYAIFFFVPILFAKQTSELFELNKMWFVWATTLVIVGAWIAKMILQRQLFLQRTPLDIPILLFLTSQIIATIISWDPYISLWGYYSRFNGGLLSLISYILLFYAFVSNYKDIDADRNEQQKTPLPKGILALLFAVVSVFLGLYLSRSAFYQYQIIFYIGLVVAFFFTVASFSLAFPRRIFLIMLVSGTIVVLWGLPVRLPGTLSFDPTCYFFKGGFDTACWTQAFRPEIRMFSTLGQPAWLAAYVAVLFPISLAFTLLLWQKMQKKLLSLSTLGIVSLAMLTISFYMVLLYTNTRAGFLAIWLGLLVFWVLVFFLRIFSRKQFLVSCIVSIAVFSIANFFIGTPISQLSNLSFARLMPASQKPVEKAPTTEAQMDTGGTDSGTIRLLVWRGAIDAWKAHPVFGTGVETFAFAYYKFRPAAHNLTSEWDYLYNKAHNEYLNYLTTSGAVGLLSYLALILIFFKEAGVFVWKKIRHAPSEKVSNNTTLLLIALISGYLTILVTNFFGFTVVIIHLFFFIIPALFFVLTKRIDNFTLFSFPHKKYAQENVSSSKYYVSGKQKITVGILLFAIFYLLFTLARYWHADTLYAKGNNYYLLGDYKSADEYLTSALNIRFSEPTYKDELAMNSAALAIEYALEKDATSAAQYAEQSLALSNDVLGSHMQNVVYWKNRVRLLNTLGSLDTKFFAHAKDAIEHVTTLAPTDAKVFFTYAVLTQRTGDTKKAIEIFKKTIELKPDYLNAYYYLANAYRDLAIDKNGTVVDPAMQEKAVASMQYILKNLSPNNLEVTKTLKSWNVSP